MTLRLAALACLLTLLTACASSAPPLTYYRLGAPTMIGAATVDERLPALVLERVTLADYLAQPGLVLQQGTYQLQVSRQHLWAESLDVALPQALLAALRDASTNYRYFLRGNDFVPAAGYGLRVHFDGFHTTDGGEVVASGRYQLVASTDGRELANRRFALRRDLRANGYPEVVSQLDALLDELAAMLVADMDGVIAR
ncbi:MAG TPA: ABC-type transport auxiliary lipoprotein family protein [Hyphomicrobiales bacterium]|nr:ABC-type transport auxiliary lipoprotein family protein [Hyphomicrobiales bacterium]